MMSERINMKCPSCNGSFIFIGEGGYLTCSYVDCPEPDIAKKVAQLESENDVLREFADHKGYCRARLRQWGDACVCGYTDARLTGGADEAG